MDHMSTAQELERAIGQDVYDVDGQKVGTATSPQSAYVRRTGGTVLQFFGRHHVQLWVTLKP